MKFSYQHTYKILTGVQVQLNLPLHSFQFPQLPTIKYYNQLINKMAMAWVIHLTSLLSLLYAKHQNTKRNNSQSLSLGYMVDNPVWSTCGLKYGNEKYVYTFVDMDMDLHSAHTLNTELSLSTTHSLRASCYGHLCQRKGVPEAGILFCSVYQESSGSRNMAS